MRTASLQAAVFVAGLGTLAYELAGLRLFAPYFGSSVFITGAVITWVLVLLTLGYALGGRMIDRRPEPQLVFSALLVVSAYASVLSLGHHIVLNAVSDLHAYLGASLSVIAFYGIPMVLLGMVAPMSVRLLAEEGRVGSAAGRVSAVGTAGAIVGSLLTTFVLIPMAGVSRTHFIVSFAIGLVGLVGYWPARKWVVVAPLGAALALALPSHRRDVIYEGESLYNYVAVHENLDTGILKLVLNSDGWTQSIANPEKFSIDATYWPSFNAGPAMAGGSRTLILGLGAGTSVLELFDAYPEAEIDAVEIDGKVVEVAHKYFDLPVEDPRLRIFTEDARRFINPKVVARRGLGPYDFVEMDLYHGGPHIPHYLMTTEAFGDIAALMEESGVLMVNVISPRYARERFLLTDVIGTTMQQVFPSVFRINLNSNQILVATKRPQSVDQLTARVDAGDSESMKAVAFLTEEFVPLGDYAPLTDDKAPLEAYTRTMLRSFDTPNEDES